MLVPARLPEALRVAPAKTGCRKTPHLPACLQTMYEGFFDSADEHPVQMNHVRGAFLCRLGALFFSEEEELPVHCLQVITDRFKASVAQFLASAEQKCASTDPHACSMSCHMARGSQADSGGRPAAAAGTWSS